MEKRLKTRSGGKILADALVAQDVKMAFGVPGESYLPLLDGLLSVSDRLSFVSCRHEGGASYMAEAYGKLTGHPGVLLLARGPGAANGAIGVHTGFNDSTPMVVLIGDVGSGFVEREAFQELDFRRIYGPMAKWVTQIDRAERIPEYISRAFHTANSGRPGPVVLALPQDMLFSVAQVEDVDQYHVVRPAPARSDIARLMDLLNQAQRPFIIVGGGGWTRDSCKRLQVWIEERGLPVATAFRRQDLIDNRSPSYAGDLGIGVNPRLAQRVKDADVLLVIGARLGELTTSGFTLVEIPQPLQTLIHVHADARELGRVYRPVLPINSGYPQLIEALDQAGNTGTKNCYWKEQTCASHAEYLGWLKPQPMPGKLQYGEVIQWLSATLPEDAIIANGAGNFTSWLHRHFQYKGFRTQLAPTNGSMGYGYPAAVAAKLAEPQRTVVAICGDGDFLMNGQEIATAAQYGAAFVTLVVNNGLYGTIRMHQERVYPARVYGTELTNPDFAAYARAFGGHGACVESTEDFPAAFQCASRSGKPALIELKIDSDALTPATTISAVREKALKQAATPAEISIE